MAYGIGRGGNMVGSPYGQVADGAGSEALRVGYRIEPDSSGAKDVNVDFWTESGTGDSSNGYALGSRYNT